ncbi:sugar ABC transporter substrate-binding protein [Clostridium sp. WB02_MRS01]|uniref:ABC transporter substrate-binding protein n=1 Tax=Clostridium sp. WB02_MRS01 TaxID=2605777 RepID=UPI0012B408FB|nr:sugar ABC transporter substrate-binding protein [Clostridium sp. WB02_MRS01]MSS09794.1 sugar ABC transporter substrate-binding protein [Clostridium sp. WB02_MRS01]
MGRKKLLALLLSTAVVCGSLAGCGAKGTQKSEGTVAGSTESKAGESSKTDSAEAGKKVTIAVWNEPSKDEALNMYLQAGKATGIDVEVTVIPESDYSSKLNQMVSTGNDSVDIYVIWENDIANFAQVGGIIPLDDYLAKSTIKTDEFIDAVAKLSEGLGGTYGLPWCAATELLYYNQDMFDAAGIAYPTNDWSYADYKAAAEKLTKKAADGTTEVYGSTLPNTQTWWAGIGGAGDQVFDPAKGQMVIGDGAVSFVSDVAQMVKNGTMPEPSSDTADLFAAGKAAMSWQGSWNIGTYGGGLAFNWDIASIPTDKLKYNTLHTGFYSINAKSKNQDSAFKVIEYLMGEEGQAINSKASGNPSAIKSIAEKGAWKVESVTTIENWDAITDSLKAGVFGYTCLPSGVTNNAISEFNSAVLGQKTPEDAVKNASQYAKETIGY